AVRQRAVLAVLPHRLVTEPPQGANENGCVDVPLDFHTARASSRKVICAAMAKGNTTVGNDWLAKRLAMGHDSYVSTLVQRIRREKRRRRFRIAMKEFVKSRTDPFQSVYIILALSTMLFYCHPAETSPSKPEERVDPVSILFRIREGQKLD